jgi:hypothetical protein
VYNNTVAWGESRGCGGVFSYNFRDPAFPQADEGTNAQSSTGTTRRPHLPTPDPADVETSPVTTSAEVSDSTQAQDQSPSSSGKRDKRKRGPRPQPPRQHHVYVNEDGTELAPGSDVPLSDAAARAVISLRTVRDHDDQFARERDAAPDSRISLAEGSGMDDDMVGRDEEGEYCKKCGVPLLPDPRPEQLFIWLHAMRYTTDRWDFASELPSWARDDWEPADGDKLVLEQH